MTRLEQELGCFGYYGFGAGFDWAKGGLTDAPVDDTSSYCHRRCPSSTSCYLAHRKRVRRFVPDLARLADGVARHMPGPRYLEVLARAEGRPIARVIEPYRDVMNANAVDGMSVALGRSPAHRGPLSLTWPLVAIPRD